MFKLDYAEALVKALPPSHICFTHLSYHPSGSTQIRSGRARGLAVSSAGAHENNRAERGHGRESYPVMAVLSTQAAIQPGRYRSRSTQMAAWSEAAWTEAVISGKISQA